MLSPGSEEVVGERQSASPSEEMGGEHFQSDDAVAASPIKIDGDSMQPKLGSNAAQFAAELADRFGMERTGACYRSEHACYSSSFIRPSVSQQA
jgi:hypothetical protein